MPTNAKLIATGNNNAAIYSPGPPSADGTLFLNGFNINYVDNTNQPAFISNGADATLGAVQSATSIITTGNQNFNLTFGIIASIANANGIFRPTYPAVGQSTWSGSLSGVGFHIIPSVTGAAGTTLVLTPTAFISTSGQMIVHQSPSNSNTLIVNTPSEINNGTLVRASGSGKIILNSTYYKVTGTAIFITVSAANVNVTYEINGQVIANNDSDASIPFVMLNQKAIFDAVDLSIARNFPITGIQNVKFRVANPFIKVNGDDGNIKVLALVSDPPPPNKVEKGVKYEYETIEGTAERAPNSAVGMGTKHWDSEGTAVFTTVIG